MKPYKNHALNCIATHRSETYAISAAHTAYSWTVIIIEAALIVVSITLNIVVATAAGAAKGPTAGDTPVWIYILIWIPPVINFYLIFTSWFAARAEDKNPTRNDKLGETLLICKELKKDKTLNSEWRRRATSIETLALLLQSRLDRYKHAPSVQQERLHPYVEKLHTAAVSLAHYQMVAGVSAHANIIGTEVDLVLESFEELEAA